MASKVTKEVIVIRLISIEIGSHFESSGFVQLCNVIKLYMLSLARLSFILLTFFKVKCVIQNFESVISVTGIDFVFETKFNFKICNPELNTSFQ